MRGYRITDFIHFGFDPDAKITVFYVVDTDAYEIKVSFAFCSPEDCMLGRFRKKDGRLLAWRRFFGIDGIKRGRAVLDMNGKYNTPYLAIRNFIILLMSKRFSVARPWISEKRAGVVPRIVLPDDGISQELVKVEGILQLPHWLTERSDLFIQDEKTAKAVNVSFGGIAT